MWTCRCQVRGGGAAASPHLLGYGGWGILGYRGNGAKHATHAHHPAPSIILYL